MARGGQRGLVLNDKFSGSNPHSAVDFKLHDSKPDPIFHSRLIPQRGPKHGPASHHSSLWEEDRIGTLPAVR